MERSNDNYVGVLAGPPFKAAHAPEVEFGYELWRPDGADGKLVPINGRGLGTTFSSAVVGASVQQDSALLGWLMLLCAGAAGLWLLQSRRRSARQVPRTLAASAWQSLGALAFAPPLEPPTVALVSPRAGLAAPSTARPQPAEGHPAQEQAVLPGQPLAPAAEEATKEGALAGGGKLVAQVKAPRVFVRVLGPDEVEEWAVPPTRQKTTELLVYLALHRDRPIGTDRLRTALWPYQPGRPDVSADTVHQELSRLRRCLGAEHFPESKGGYQLGEGVETDWQRFQALAEAAATLGEERSIELLKEALALVRGQPFEGAGKGYSWAFDEVLVAKIEMAVAKAAHLMSARCLNLGRLDEAVWAVRQGLLAGPGDEQVWEDALAVAAARGGWSALDRTWREAERATGPQPPGTPLYEAYKRLRDGR
ncbi:MAG: winged helix-turn-helix domain-containing protein [Actinomycetota bacterium]|nr:winged helix-turn-helix domain-containing protein [Actinomycetota bacterium]